MEEQRSTVSRRQFIRAGAGLGGALALGMSLRPLASHAQSLKVAGAKEVPSVCPYCAVGCGTLISVKGGQVINIEGNPDSPINRGTLCPKGAASFQLTVNPLRSKQALYRKPGGTEWEQIDLGKAMDMIADRVKKTRDATFVETVTAKGADGQDVQKKANHTKAIFSLGGATMDNEWNYVHAKLMRGLGVIAIENQARIWHSATVPGLGISLGRGGASTFSMDLQHSDAIMIMGSNMAECHPVAFRWPMKAKAKGAKIIHVDPRFTRTSAMANTYAPLRAGSDIVFLGALVNYIINSKRWNEEPFFKQYVLNYTNAATLISADYKGPEDLDGLFSGWDAQAKRYNNVSSG